MKRDRPDDTNGLTLTLYPGYQTVQELFNANLTVHRDSDQHDHVAPCLVILAPK